MAAGHLTLIPLALAYPTVWTTGHVRSVEPLSLLWVVGYGVPHGEKSITLYASVVSVPRDCGFAGN